MHSFTLKKSCELGIPEVILAILHQLDEAALPATRNRKLCRESLAITNGNKIMFADKQKKSKSNKEFDFSPRS
jgi:hypothetical protein